MVRVYLVHSRLQGSSPKRILDNCRQLSRARPQLEPGRRQCSRIYRHIYEQMCPILFLKKHKTATDRGSLGHSGGQEQNEDASKRVVGPCAARSTGRVTSRVQRSFSKHRPSRVSCEFDRHASCKETHEISVGEERCAMQNQYLPRGWVEWSTGGTE